MSEIAAQMTSAKDAHTCNRAWLTLLDFFTLSTRREVPLQHHVRPPQTARQPCSPVFIRPCFTPVRSSGYTSVRRGGAQDQEKRALEAYFAEHRIQEKLNSMLNEMVQVRPHMPYHWLAKRMRQDGSAPSAGTMPQLAPAAQKALGGDLEKQWSFALGLQVRSGSAPSAPVAAAPPKRSAVASGADGVLLTIEGLSAASSGVLLAIRAQ